MNRLELNNLIDKVNDGMASEEELHLYTAYLNQLTSGNEEWDLEFLGAEESVKKELSCRIEAIRNPAKIRRITLWPRIAVAAAVLAVTLGIWLYYSGNMLYMNGRYPDTTLSSRVPRDLNDIAPGKNSAILTLANGKVINLSDVKTGVVIGDDLKYNDGTEVAKISPSGGDGVAREGSRMLTASTPRGGTYQVTLPDGTHVWLNADSKISFPSRFSGKDRRILLSGEAYFEVAKVYLDSSDLTKGLSVSKEGAQKRMPFIVQTDKQQVEVLGTHFNINAYPNERSVKTTLLEGSVSVSLKNMHLKTENEKMGAKNTNADTKNAAKILIPGYEAVNSGNSIEVHKVDPELAVAWKNNRFLFENEELGNIMRQIERWYNVDVEFKDNISHEKFGGGVSRFDNVSKVLKSLEATGKVNFKIEGKKIYVSGKK